MKFTLSLISTLLCIGLVSAAAFPSNLETRGGRPPVCSPRSQAVPLFRAYNAQVIDHFYTTNSRELRATGYASEDNAVYIFSYQQPQTTALFRLYSTSATDHFYTTDVGERNNAVRSLGYKYEGVTGFVYTTAVCGSVPLYRLYSAQGMDHFYTTSASERDSAAGNGYAVEGIAGYVFAGLL